MAREEAVDAYLRYYKTNLQMYWWAVDEIDGLVRRDPEEGWETTCMLISRATSDELLANVAAGPLEDLLVAYGPELIGRVEEECKRNDRLRLALSGVWFGRDNPIYQRWYALVWKYGFAEGKRYPL